MQEVHARKSLYTTEAMTSPAGKCCERVVMSNAMVSKLLRQLWCSTHAELRLSRHENCGVPSFSPTFRHTECCEIESTCNITVLYTYSYIAYATISCSSDYRSFEHAADNRTLKTPNVVTLCLPLSKRFSSFLILRNGLCFRATEVPGGL